MLANAREPVRLFAPDSVPTAALHPVQITVCHPKHELLVHLIDPSRSVEGNYRVYSVLTTEGQALSGLLAFALSPLVAFLCGLENMEVVAASLLAILVLVSHRKNIREEFARVFPGRPVKETTASDP